MKTLILHIGYPKTGTSSLQWFLNAWRDELRRQDVYYPLAGQGSDYAHHKLAFSLAANAYESWETRERTALFKQLTEEIDGCGCSTIVISSELFLGRLELIQASEEFQGLLAGKKLKVVCCLRSQETFLESLYRQFILDPTVKFSDTPEVFLKDYPMAGEYHAILTAWSGLVGKDTLVPLIYEQAVNSGGLLATFCRLLNVDTAHLPADDLDARKNVTTENALGIEIVRMSNAVPDLSIEQRLEIGRAARAFAESTGHLPLPKRIFSDVHLERIHSLFADTNRRLAEDFVHQPLNGFWFAPDAVAAPLEAGLLLK